MKPFQEVTSDSYDKHLHEADPVSAYHHCVLSSILPDAEQEYLSIKKKNKALREENEVLKRKVECWMSDSGQFKSGQRQVFRNRDHPRNQVMHCDNELSVLGKRLVIQETDLRRGHKQNEALREELESVEKELQSVKQAAVNQRAGQQHLKKQLDQVIKERDGLNDKLRRCQNECSELRDKIANQQSNLNRKGSQCKEQSKQIHLLKLENQKLERERGIRENAAEDQRRELKESKRFRALAGQRGKKIVIIQQTPRTSLLRTPNQDVLLSKIQKELLTQTEELRKTQELCEELKQSLTQVAVQFQQCQVVVRDQKEKLKAVTAERNMYQSETERLMMELADIAKGRRSEEQRNRATKRTTKVNLSSGDKSSQSHLPPTSPRLHLKTGDKVKPSHLPPISSKVQAQSELRIVGRKM